MKFMMLHKTNAHWENGALPTRELVAGVGKMVGDAVRAGKLVAGDGMRQSALGARLTFKNGARTVTPGPFVGGNELIAGYSVMRVASLDEAVEWAARVAAIVGDVEIDIRPATETWHLGLGKRPPDLESERYIAMHKADARSEAGKSLTPSQRRALDALFEEMTTAGVLLGRDTLAPSSQAVRLRHFGGKKTLVDGPFAESKELVGGFVTLELDSRAEAIAWARDYVDVLGEVELDILRIAE